MLGWSVERSDAAPWVPLLWSVLYLAGGYGFNGACDWRTDDPGKNPIREAAVSPSLAGGLALTILLAPIGVAYFLMPDILWLAAGMVSLGIVYSLPHWGLKRIPGIVTVANVALFVPLFWIGADRLPEFQIRDILPVLVLAIPSLQSQLVHELGDMREDRRSGVTSTAIFLGERTVCRILQVSGIATMLIAVFALKTHTFSILVAVLFSAAGAFSMVPSETTQGGYRRWRKRLKLAYLIPCTAWLIEGMVSRAI